MAASLTVVVAGCVPAAPRAAPPPAAVLVVTHDSPYDPILLYSDIVAGYRTPVTFTITNVGDATSGPVSFRSDVCDAGCSFSFTVSNTGCAPLAPGESCTNEVRYEPFVPEPRVDAWTLYVGADPGGSVPFDMVGFGFPSLVPVPFRPEVTDSVSAAGGTSTTVTIENWTDGSIGPLELEPFSSWPTVGTFTVSDSTCGAPTPVDGSCTFTLWYEAANTGTLSGSITVRDPVNGLWLELYPQGLGVP